MFTNAFAFWNGISEPAEPTFLYLLVGGEFTTYRGVSRVGISLLNTDATAATSFTPAAYSGSVNHLQYQSTGKLLFGGSTFSGAILRRLNANYTADATFSPVGVTGVMRTLLVLPDDKIIVGGNFLTRRLLIDGANDSTFVASAFDQQPYSTIRQSDGKIVMVGTFTTYGGVSSSRIVRLNTNGSRDTEFSIGTGFSSFAKVIKQHSDGKLYVIGIFTSYNGTTINGIARLFSTGTIDTGFNPGGGTTAAESLAIQSDGKVIIGGSFTSYAGTSINRIARINTNGTIDTTFNVGTGFNGTVFSLEIQSDGKIIVGGSFTTFNGTTRNRLVILNSDGTLDTSFDPLAGYNATVLSSLREITGASSDGSPAPTPTATPTPTPTATPTPTPTPTSTPTIGIPSFITSTNKLPIFGTGGATTHPPSGWTSLQNSSADDAFRTFNTSFNFTINNTNYTAHNIGSNTYITWGGGSNAFSSLSASNPALNKLHLGAADNSFQRVSSLQLSNYSRVRYEGNQSTSGTVGSPGIVLEVTIFNPANYGGQQVIEVLVGNHGRTTGQAGIATTSTYYTTWSMAVNTSFVLVGNSTGTSWTRYLGHVNDSGY
jgi:uncharacterized delta-60 repeat protein